MIPSAISSKMLRRLGAIGYSTGDLPTTFSYSGTLKEVLINCHIEKDVSIINSSVLEVTMNKSDYLSALMTDIHFGKMRIEKQSLNIECQINGDQQPAWILVSTYYASYFLACDIAKLCGQFITNIPSAGISQLLQQVSTGNPSQFASDNDVSLAANVSLGAYENEVTIRLAKTAAKPHKVAWTNLHGILKDVDVRSSQVRLDRLKDIVDSQCQRWRLPSTIRNEWNYSSTHYYGNTGNELADLFLSLMKNPNSSFKVFGNNTLPASERNIAASIVYVYDVLKSAHTKTIEKIKLP